jgi:hypothetical protein
MYYGLDIYSKASKKMFAYHSSDSRKDILHLKKMYDTNEFVYIKECYGETDADKQIYRESSKYGSTTATS